MPLEVLLFVICIPFTNFVTRVTLSTNFFSCFLNQASHGSIPFFISSELAFVCFSDVYRLYHAQSQKFLGFITLKMAKKAQREAFWSKHAKN